MVQNQRYKVVRKQQVVESESTTTLLLKIGNSFNRATRPKLLSILLLLSFSIISAPHLFTSLIDSMGVEIEDHVGGADHVNVPMCSSATNGSMCCDRSSRRSDICFMKGDIRTQPTLNSLFLYTNHASALAERIRPYTRKWETNVMTTTVTQLHLVSKPHHNDDDDHECDVTHDVPALLFSTGGYTGNVYHEFNDGIVPLYITSRHLDRKVVLLVLDYHDWWVTKYQDVLSRLSDRPPLDFHGDNRTHCFPQAIVGLRIHGELTLDPEGNGGTTIAAGFKSLLDQAYSPRIRFLNQETRSRKFKNKKQEPAGSRTGVQELEPRTRASSQESRNERPRLVVVSRNGSRRLLNENSLVKMAGRIGFRVEVLRPGPETELAKIYRVLNASDVMVGVHGAAMTHFLFMRPASVFIQIIPLGTVWAAETYYGEPAVKLGLKYSGYKIALRESSLCDMYEKDDIILREPERVTNKGWEVTKKIYLDRQNVRLDLRRFRSSLVRAYRYSISKIHQ